MSYGNFDGKIEVYSPLESLGSEAGTEVGFSCRLSVGNVEGKLEDPALGEKQGL